jgi:energy-coupling factor transporter ATP-binding protein EcfA2
LNDEEGLREAVALLTDRSPPERLTILHLHGRMDRPEGIVLDADSYQELAGRNHLEFLIFSLARTRTMLFVGTTLNEFHVRFQLRKHRCDRRHVLLCKADHEEGLTTGSDGISEKRDGIIVSTYGDHHELDGFAAKLSAVSRAAIPASPVAAAAVAATANPALPFGYVASVLFEQGQRIEETDRLAAALLGRDYGPEPFGEADIAQGQRTVVLGAPGSGKSELLRKAGELVPHNEFPVLVRCADLEIEAGDALTVLERAAQRGTGLRGDVVVSREALQRRRFHFFFDGLDEKSVSQQEDLAHVILRLAETLPQHRFTVATRPVDAVDVFPRTGDDAGEWRVLELVPDHDWQTRYLEAAGVSLADLEAQMPALTDLAALLHLPFFLAKTVELYHEDKLAEFEDLWALVQGLVTSALERETDVPLPEVDARAWLRDAALAMHLAGRTSLGLEEIEQVPMPTDTATMIGSAKDVADQLVVRFLLQEQGGSYRFAHRIIGEALAAEALDSLPPEGTILDAVVPERDEEVRGVRRDWLVPLTFLLGRNANWRHEVASRDPLAAARSVPATAPHGERESAARAIWGTYCEHKVWIWDYDVPELVEDAEALGRLLQTDALEGTVEQIRQGIDDASPQIQGNALRVLSRVKPEGFVDDLRRVLEDDNRKAVVRRQAAIAARDTGADELLPLIIHRAANPADTAEAQDCSLCAFELAGAERLVETAVELVQSDEARSMALARLERKATNEQLVRFLRVAAETESDPAGSEKELFHQTLESVVEDG